MPLYGDIGDNPQFAPSDRKLRAVGEAAGMVAVAAPEAATPGWRHARTGQCWGCDAPNCRLDKDGLCRSCVRDLADVAQ